MIRDVAELRERGQVCRRCDELDVDVETWRAGMRRAARREDMRIRTFIVRPLPGSDPPEIPGAGEDVDDDLGPAAAAVSLVYAVRTDLPPEPRVMLAAMDAAAAGPDGPPAEQASVSSLADARARRSGHPCTRTDPGGDEPAPT